MNNIGISISEGYTANISSDFNFLTNMLKSYSTVSDKELSKYVEKITIEAVNAVSDGDKYGLNSQELNQLKRAFSKDFNEGIKEVFSKGNDRVDAGNNLVKLNQKALSLSSIVLEKLHTTINFEEDSEALTIFNDKCKEEVFSRSRRATYAGKNASVKPTDIETMIIDLSNLSQEKREEVFGNIKKAKLTNLFSSVTMQKNKVFVSYSRQHINDIEDKFGRTKQSNLTFDTAHKSSKDINLTSLKIFEHLAQTNPELNYTIKNKFGGTANLVNSNDILHTSNPAYEQAKDKIKDTVDKIKAVESSNTNQKRGSNEPSSNIRAIMTDKDIKPVKKFDPEQKIIQKASIAEALDLKTTKVVDVAEEFARLKLEEVKRQIETASNLVEDLSSKYIGYLEGGATVEKAKKNISESARGNEIAVDMAILVASKSLQEVRGNYFEVKGKNETLTKLNSGLKEAIEVLNGNLKTLESLKVQVEKNFSKFRDEAKVKMTELNEKIKLVISQRDEAIGDYNKLDKEFDILLSKKVALEDKVENLGKLNESLSKQVSDLNSKNKTLEDNFSKFRDETKGKITELNSKNGTLESKVENLGNLNQSLSKQVHNLNAINISLEGKIETAEKKVTGVESQNTTLNLEVENLTGKLSTQEKEFEVANNASINKIGELTTENSKIKTTLTSQEQEIEALKAQLEDRDREVAGLKAESNTEDFEEGNEDTNTSKPKHKQ